MANPPRVLLLLDLFSIDGCKCERTGAVLVRVVAGRCAMLVLVAAGRGSVVEAQLWELHRWRLLQVASSLLPL